MSANSGNIQEIQNVLGVGREEIMRGFFLCLIFLVYFYCGLVGFVGLYVSWVFLKQLLSSAGNPQCGLQSKLILKARFYPKGESVENKLKWTINYKGNGVTRYRNFRFECIYVQKI